MAFQTTLPGVPLAPSHADHMQVLKQFHKDFEQTLVRDGTPSRQHYMTIVRWELHDALAHALAMLSLITDKNNAVKLTEENARLRHEIEAQKAEINMLRTRATELKHGNSPMWSASSHVVDAQNYATQSSTLLNTLKTWWK